MPRLIICFASPFVKFAIPAFVSAESSRFADGSYAFTELVLMMAEPGGMCGIAAFVIQNIACRLVRNVQSNCSVVMSRIES